MIPPEKYFQSLKRAFEDHASEAEAAQMHEYLLGHFTFYGIKQGPRRALVKTFLEKEGLCTYEDLRYYIHWLYTQEQREYHYTALDLVLKHKRNWREDIVGLAEYMITYRSWWDTVDMVASNVIGAYWLKQPGGKSEFLERWIVSSNLWLNRTAIIFQLKYKMDTDTDWLIRSIEPHINSEQFFLQKAIGWALRQYSKFNPTWVIDFVTQRNLMPLSYKEAMRIINK